MTPSPPPTFSRTAVADDLLPALLFIPDISGFTRFVHETNTRVSRTLIAELLDILIEANILDLELVEIQGDAILFYRPGPPPTIQEVVAQCKQLFLDFQNYLRIVERNRDSEIGAVLANTDLTLKIVVHYGRLTVTQIRQYKKLMGLDVIVAHRLLKNDIGTSEYVLLTENYLATQPEKEIAQSFDWTRLEAGSTRYEHVGTVTYRYATLTPLRVLVAGLLHSTDSDAICPQSIMVEGYLPVPVHFVLRVLNNFRLKPRWVPGMTAAALDVTKADRILPSYVCTLGRHTIYLQTVQTMGKQDRVEYVEKLSNFRWFPNSLVFYHLRPEGERTHLAIEFCYSQVSHINMLIVVFARRRMKAYLERMLNNLSSLCRELYQQHSSPSD